MGKIIASAGNRSVVTAVALGLLLSAGTAAAKEFPYLAYVTAPDAPVLSGPGGDHYLVQRLAQGSSVEVYRHDPGGWFAVRPPQGCFSWVRADQISTTDQGNLGLVAVDGVVTRVGSRYGDEHHVEYVHLRKGECVELLGTKRLTEPDGTTSAVWYAISPPPGEFRWIRGEQISRQSAAPPDAAQAAFNWKEGEQQGAVRQASAEQTVRSAFEDVTPRVNHQPPQDQPDGGWTSPAAQAAQAAPSPQRVAAALEMRLTEIVSQPTEQWDFQALSAAVAEASRREQPPEVRQRLDYIARKIQEFEQIHAQHEQLFGPGQPVTIAPPSSRRPRPFGVDFAGLFDRIGKAVRGPAAPREYTAQPPAEATAAAAQPPVFQGTGYLVAVDQRQRGMPPYALVDENGMTLSTVSPAPGLNLNRYVHQKVGIRGVEQYSAQTNRKHITAERVVVLSDESATLRR